MDGWSILAPLGVVFNALGLVSAVWLILLPGDRPWAWALVVLNCVGLTLNSLSTWAAWR